MRWAEDRSNRWGPKQRTKVTEIILRFDIQGLREEERKERKHKLEEGRPPLYRQLCYMLFCVMETP